MKGGGERPHEKVWDALVASIRGITEEFWSHLGVHDETPLLLAVKVYFRMPSKK